MAKKEPNLNRANSIADPDLIRVVVDDESKNILFSKLASAIGLTAVSQIVYKVRSTSINDALNTTDGVLLVDATAGNISISLPSAASAYDTASSQGQTFVIKKIDSSLTYKVIITPNGGELVDGGSPIDLIEDQKPFLAIVSNGASWNII